MRRNLAEPGDAGVAEVGGLRGWRGLQWRRGPAAVRDTHDTCERRGHRREEAGFYRLGPRNGPQSPRPRRAPAKPWRASIDGLPFEDREGGAAFVFPQTGYDFLGQRHRARLLLGAL
jgi:hypothetical protein